MPIIQTRLKFPLKLLEALTATKTKLKVSTKRTLFTAVFV